MKQIYAVAALLMSSVAWCDEPNRDTEVPLEHWAYEALEIVAPRDDLGCTLIRVSGPVSMTRYEFAVAFARSLRNSAWSLRIEKEREMKTGTTKLERRDAFVALNREFSVELADLGIRDPNNLLFENRAGKQLRLSPPAPPH